MLSRGNSTGHDQDDLRGLGESSLVMYGVIASIYSWVASSSTLSLLPPARRTVATSSQRLRLQRQLRLSPSRPMTWRRNVSVRIGIPTIDVAFLSSLASPSESHKHL